MYINVTDKLQDLLSFALSAQATDIHFFPEHSSEQVVVRYRMNGTLENRETLPMLLYEKLLQHLKFSSSLDIGEKRLPQSGSYLFKLKNEHFPLRVSTLPGRPLEHLVIRLLPSQTLQLSELSLFPNQTDQLFAMSQIPHGLLLVSGPTGAGKSTTLYALLQTIANAGHKHIVTLEDPVEMSLEHIVQLQVNERSGFSYAEGLRSILRHDPDVIVIGEIRDALTAKMAVRAALTGHLVLSTIHGSNAFSVGRRMIDYGVLEMDLDDCLLGVVSQRLTQLTVSPANKRTRAAIFDVAPNKTWKTEERHYKGINQQLLKAYVCGYISNSERRRWTMLEMEA
ncbi:ATPase, T2SS/T4P/T4SS family [Aureibacillus halotolerans]|uniref:Competence-related pilin export protein ComGA n=1 Tax=Aureibacillus halotolerans TaxID=1508390 RepID=A0A4R6UA01_9BACI|nr:ATPase, T2SS/T4P/T4SS family [Aureibacillus halotolerans]TDQ41679.1 competence-related pilin export protein ComGA [Aureibacillus halotolerans]